MMSSAVSRYVGQAAGRRRRGSTDNKPVLIGFTNLRDITNNEDIRNKSHDIATADDQVYAAPSISPLLISGLMWLVVVAYQAVFGCFLEPSVSGIHR